MAPTFAEAQKKDFWRDYLINIHASKEEIGQKLVTLRAERQKKSPETTIWNQKTSVEGRQTLRTAQPAASFGQPLAMVPSR